MVPVFQRSIILRGIVEGVGMRPALFRLARRFGLHGYAVNRANRVELVLQGRQEDVEQCFARLETALPPGARLEAPPEFQDEWIGQTDGAFRIRSAGQEAGINLLTPPDLAMCPRCRAEMNDPADRRYRYAFNSCGECGPRASVSRILPYERRNTAWHDFPLCADCRREYEDPADRRFHIEGISCPNCGPRLTPSLESALGVLANGGIVALKGVGGYQLLADPRNPAAVRKLREFKQRPEKPLALMARSLDSLRKYCAVTPLQEELLASAAAPIVLLNWTAEPLELLNPDNPREIGVMLPSSPLHELLLNGFSGELLIATSGNRHSEPPALDGQEAAERLAGIDCILSHDRAIYWRHDDSLAVENLGRPQYWRTGRGCRWSVPGFELPDRRVLALGGALKNTFAMSGNGSLFMSPHHGDLEDLDTASGWEKALEQTLALVREPLDAIAVDLHPDYYSTRYGEKLAARLGAPLVRVPHHYAHALAALFESRKEKALALVFDGNGLGPDGALWGAELLSVSRGEGGRRLATWEAAPLPGGELAIREPWRQLAGRLHAAGLPTDPMIARQCEKRLNTPFSHAAGRLFDAFAARLGIAPRRISYEGQSAIRLETAARRENPRDAVIHPWHAREQDGIWYIDWAPMFRDETRTSAPAFSFHRTVAAAALEMVKHGLKHGSYDTVLLTGGVFQNRLLTELTAELLGQYGLETFIPERIPPNDAGISAGQSCWSGLNFKISGVHYLI
jgi:hydrogenase maturation protein HypF